MGFHIGDIVRVDGTRIKSAITHIQAAREGKPTRYKVDGRYWNEPSISLIKAAPARDSAQDRRARLHNALDAVMDRARARDDR
jgi:hypothetical protein